MTLTTHKPCLLSTLALLTFFSMVSAHEQGSDNYTMPKDVLSNGGDKSNSSNYKMVATVGQYATRKGTANGNVLYPGFYSPRSTRSPAPASCQLYAVNDKGLNNSQFFTVNLDDLTISKLGPMYKGYDIEALAIHPETNMIYAASGDNVTNGKKGHFYRVDGETGELFPVGSSGFQEIEDLTFSPGGTLLYAWAKGDGLITIEYLTTGVGTLV
ncbi:MAG: hypothetical protein GY706_09810, partial [Bacteroides sp.]|nr:hypothetical protein [Bacteroides sp.]